MKVKIVDLQTKILKVLKNISKKDAIAITKYIIWTEMTGNRTQGIAKLIGHDAPQNMNKILPITILQETKNSALIDGGRNHAIIVSNKAVDIAIAKAKKNGISVVGAKNTFSGNGAQGYYVEKIAAAGMIGIMCSRSPGFVSAFGSIDPLFGTNPIAYAFPTQDNPIIFDATMSEMTYYGLVVADTKGEQIPENTATDKNGKLTTNPASVLDGGAIRPFGNSYKASGLAMLVELLSGSLIDNCENFGKGWGTFIIAINPALFGNKKTFKKNTSAFIEQIHGSRVTSGGKIRMPHDNARKNFIAASKSGEVKIDNTLYAKIFGNKK